MAEREIPLRLGPVRVLEFQAEEYHLRTQEVDEVTLVMESYIQGTREGDAELLRRVFHPEAMVAGWFGGDLLLRRPDGFIARAASTESGPNYKATIGSISVIGRTATATIYEDGLWDDRSFVNLFQLIRDAGNHWVITAKLFHMD
ncbi:nuclear transport factor 2 family protein [Maritimibacter dapengensis]|uniref:Nuclear transport factor 2 family protein n=1 Tax=Maritimibacter dapengensis TaxID=2836868 RepID=A0ABS6T338_9RHOB|nr:nuclear transport factor 2 family protein [Maritimibacter dapengensis]MBV7379671.1 nuclear transport factor 2 family protein [Maritimibacter dapengensis]